MQSLESLSRFLPSWLPGLKRPLQVGLVAGLLTAAITLVIPNEYRSESRILPADARGSAGLGAMAAAAAAVGVSIPGQESPDAAYVDILNSRWLRERLAQKTYTFRVRTWYFGSPREKTQTLAEYLGQKANLDRAVKALRAHITVTRDFKTKLLTIGVETTSPELSQQVAQDAVRLLETFVMERTRTRGGTKAEFAEKRLKEAQGEYAEAEDAFRRFLDGNRNFQTSADPVVRLKGTRLEAELRLRTQVVTTLAIAREQALMEEKNDMPILNVLDAGNLPVDKSGPGRGAMVVAVFLLSTLVWWAAMSGVIASYLGSLRHPRE
jgi:hypothetical protein